MRALFLGSDPWSVPSLQALSHAPQIDLVLVVTRAPRPAGRGSVLTSTAVALAARKAGLPLLEVETVRAGAGLTGLREARPDMLVVVAYGEILPGEVLGVPTLGAVNLHFSLLPRWRGAAPVQRAILAGDLTTGVTTMLIDSGLDTGPILLQRKEPIRPDDDSGTLGARLATLGAELLVETLERWAGLTPEPQDGALATSAPKLGAEERWVDWDDAAEAIVRRVRALAPEPGASARFRGKVLKVLSAETMDGAGEPGRIVAAGKQGFVVAAGRGAVRPLEVAPEGRRRMSGQEFVRGSRPEPGEKLE